MTIRRVLAGILVVSTEDIRADCGLVVENGAVVEVAPNPVLAGGGGILDARDAVVCPGFVNAHTHMYGMLAHGMELCAHGSSLRQVLEQFWWPCVEDRIDHSFLEAATAAACVDMLRGGVTCFNDILEAPYAIPGALGVEARVVERSGMRAVLSFEATERVNSANGQAGLQENLAFARRCRAENGLIRGMMCVHTTFTCSPAFLSLAKEMASREGLPIQMHLSESSDERQHTLSVYGCLPAEVYAKIGFLGPDVLASQCVVMDERELDLLAGAGVRVSHQPVSNCNVGGGIAPVPEMLARGIPVALGSDGEVNDMFSVMRAALLLQRGYRRDAAALTAAAVFRMATEGGGRVLGIPGLGTLAPGAPADLLVVGTDGGTPITAQNVLEQLVMYRGPAHLRAVVVNGELVWHQGTSLGLNEAEVWRWFREAAAEFWRTTPS